MTIAVKDASGATVYLPISTYDANGNLQVSMASAPLPTGAAKSTDIAAIIAALAPLATDADLQAVTAKMEMVRALLAAVLNVQGTVTANFGTLNGAALDASVQAAVTALGTLHSDVGSSHADLTAILTRLGQALVVGLPAGASTDASVQAITAAVNALKTALGSPVQAGGSVAVSNQISGYALDATLQAIKTALQAVLTVRQPDSIATGTIAAATANATYAVALANAEGVVGFALSGLTASGAVLTAEAANDGGTQWMPVNLVSPSTGALSQTATIDGNYRVNVGGHTNVRLRVSTVGTGTINVASIASSQNPLVGLSGPVTTTPVGLGAMQAVPAATTNGAALGTAPAGAKGARLYLPTGAAITYTIASSTPSSAPANTFTVSQSATGPNWDEDLAGGQMIYVTAVTGSPVFRWY